MGWTCVEAGLDWERASKGRSWRFGKCGLTNRLAVKAKVCSKHPGANKFLKKNSPVLLLHIYIFRKDLSIIIPRQWQVKSGFLLLTSDSLNNEDKKPKFRHWVEKLIAFIVHSSELWIKYLRIYVRNEKMKNVKFLNDGPHLKNFKIISLRSKLHHSGVNAFINKSEEWILKSMDFLIQYPIVGFISSLSSE